MFFYKKIIFIFFILLWNNGYTQNETNNWYFGNKVGLQFIAPQPLPLINGKLISVEGSSSLSDPNGNLLFYTNGENVLGKDHNTLTNGNNLLGDLSSTNNTLLVPLPENDSLYCLFTIGAANQQGKGFRFNLINQERNNGYGEVVIKNQLIEPLAFEKLAAIRHCNNKDIWIIIHKWNSDEYHAYLLTALGLSTSPVISRTGLFISGIQENAVGVLKFFSNGLRLAAAHSYQNNVIELMDFDKRTGVISNPVQFKTSLPGTPVNYTGVYGLEFSPNGNLLYATENNLRDSDGFLYQFDISSNNPAIIFASKKNIATNPLNFAGQLQLAKNDVIYAALDRKDYIAAILNPNVIGPGCNFVKQEVFLGQRDSNTVSFGLPNFLQSYFDPPSNPYTFSVEQRFCTNQEVRFSLNRISGLDSVKWNFGDARISTALNPVHTYTDTGFFTIKLWAYYNGCIGPAVDSSSRKIWIAGFDKLLKEDTVFCSFVNQSIQSKITLPAATYLWNTGEILPRINITSPGKYWLNLSYNECLFSDTISLLLKEEKVAFILGDSVICASKPIRLSAKKTTYPFVNYQWSTGEKTEAITISKPGKYKLTVTENCTDTDSITVLPGDCEVFFPNVFTPNDDGKNDLFGAASFFNAKNFRLLIFDRWGNKIFESTDPIQKWDGRFKGKTMAKGSYFWMMNYTNTKGIVKNQQGMVVLLR